VLACFWVLPAFLLLGLVQRHLRTRQRLVELSGQVLSASSEERRRLSRELHDGVAQNLQAAKLGLQLAADGQLPEVDGYKQAIDLVSHSVDELRVVAQDLRPLQSDRGSLGHALARHAEILTARSGIAVSFEYHRGPDAADEDPNLAEHLYRIAQEAIGNAIRHGRSREIRVTLDEMGQQVRLRIDDDGEGFDLERAESGEGGIGLSTMRERAALIGGELRVSSSRGGTRIEVVGAAAGGTPRRWRR